MKRKVPHGSGPNKRIEANTDDFTVFFVEGDVLIATFKKWQIDESCSDYIKGWTRMSIIEWKTNSIFVETLYDPDCVRIIVSCEIRGNLPDGPAPRSIDYLYGLAEYFCAENFFKRLAPVENTKLFNEPNFQIILTHFGRTRCRNYDGFVVPRSVLKKVIPMMESKLFYGRGRNILHLGHYIYADPNHLESIFKFSFHGEKILGPDMLRFRIYFCASRFGFSILLKTMRNHLLRTVTCVKMSLPEFVAFGECLCNLEPLKFLEWYNERRMPIIDHHHLEGPDITVSGFPLIVSKSLDLKAPVWQKLLEYADNPFERVTERAEIAMSIFTERVDVRRQGPTLQIIIPVTESGLQLQILIEKVLEQL